MSNNNNDKTCPDTNIDKDQDVASLCREIQQKKKEIMGWGETISAIAETPVKLVDSIFNGLKSKTKVDQKTIEEVRLQISNQNIIDLESSCEKNINNVQVNKIGLQKGCLKELGKILPPELVADIIKNTRIRGAVQKNTSGMNTQCNINVMLDIINKLDTTSSTIAIMDAIAEADGLLAESEVSQENCKIIDTNVDTCTYIKQRESCLNKYQNNQSNIINACGVTDISDTYQSNVLDVNNICSISNATGLSNEVVQDISTEVEFTGKGSSKGLTMDFLAFLVIIGLCIIAFPVISTISLKKNLFKNMKIFGITMILLAVVFVIIHFSRKVYTYNSDISDRNTVTQQRALGKKSVNDIVYTKKIGDSISYDDIETEFEYAKEENSDIIGYRFISSRGETEVGVINYIVDIKSNPEVGAVQKDISEAVYILKTRSKWPIITGIMLASLGIGVLAYVFMKKEK